MEQLSFREWILTENDSPKCPKCGANMVRRKGQYGEFWGCSRYSQGCRGTVSIASQKPESKPTSKPEIKSPMAASKPTVIDPNLWVAAFAKIDIQGLKNGEKIAVRAKGSDWEFESLETDAKGVLSTSNIRGSIESFKGDDKQPMRGESPAALAKLLNITKKVKSPDEDGPQEDRHPREDGDLLYPAKKYKLLPEQKKIDEKFKSIIESGNQSHVMIDALAGSGKTTVLKHLAWKYGNMGQKWLYLVFNKKNQVEAKAAFPDWVSVYTTNGFLNQMLKSRANKTRIPQTDYVAGLAGDEDGNSGKIEKIREIVQGGKFTSLMSSWGLLDPDEASRHRSVPMRNQKTIASLFKQIRYHFKEEAIRLTNLAKSFAIDHRKPEVASKVLDDIFDKYDIDSGLSDVKERISKYSPSFSDMVIDIMESITGYNFMEKDYKEEMINATKWLLHETMPHVSDHMHNRGTRKYRLGSYRDFNDDLWFAATHADELVWDKFDVVLADEVQDFNEPQKIMLKKLHDAGAKIVAVGDKNQSLYRFRGADSDSFDNVAKSLEELSHDKNVKTNLTHNMRSRKKILDFANSVTHVNNLKQGKKFADGGEGEVTENEMKFDDAFSMLQREMQQGGKLTKSTAFLSRTNEPLAHTALKLLYLGIPFVIVGKDIAGDLTKHIRKIMGFANLSERSPVEDLSAKLQDHINQEKDHHEGDNAKKAYLKELDEVTGALTAAISQFTGASNDGGYSYNRSGKTIDDFSRWLYAKLGGLNIEEKEKDYTSYKEKLEQNAVVLTTAHRSKGLEFHRVFILRYDQFPHPKAKRDADLKQEANGKYVSLTRAMDELHILKLEGQPGYKGESDESE